MNETRLEYEVNFENRWKELWSKIGLQTGKLIINNKLLLQFLLLFLNNNK